jgi:hypothetical protein
LLVGEAHSQLPRRQLRNLQCQSDDLATDIIGDAIPDTIWSGTVVSQRLRPALTISVIPAVERSAGDAECPSALVLPALYPVRISVSSSLLAATMNQKSSLREDPKFVS